MGVKRLMVLKSSAARIADVCSMPHVFSSVPATPNTESCAAVAARLALSNAAGAGAAALSEGSGAEGNSCVLSNAMKVKRTTVMMVGSSGPSVATARSLTQTGYVAQQAAVSTKKTRATLMSNPAGRPSAVSPRKACSDTSLTPLRRVASLPPLLAATAPAVAAAVAAVSAAPAGVGSGHRRRGGGASTTDSVLRSTGGNPLHGLAYPAAPLAQPSAELQGAVSKTAWGLPGAARKSSTCTPIRVQGKGAVVRTPCGAISPDGARRERSSRGRGWRA
mmetsp:Transcript_60096/g.152512  ORF Transcript_60096/g.152512 Transcript_60096/m.152512 type:complete len:277 (+) Transcript_60096:678-1508(+)